MAIQKILPFALIFLFCVAFAPFHHGWADYDQETTLNYTGPIQELIYENPHALAKVKQKKKVWTVYLAPLSRMEARGLNADMIKKGTTIQVVGYPHKANKNEMRAERIFVNGTKYELR